MKRFEFYLSLLVILILASLPYGIAIISAGEDAVFTGAIYNAMDNASYLAKMYQGRLGAWSFTLPYTAEPGSGTYLFMFYVFLGHVARWTRLSLILTYHIARIVSSVLLLLALRAFLERIFSKHPIMLRFVFWLLIMGSGMGWLVIGTGYMTADYWVAEAYPFQSMLLNPHFPLGMAVLVRIFTLLMDETIAYREWRLLGLGLALSIVMPFGVVIALLVATGWVVWSWLETRCLYWKPYVSLGALGGPFLLYQYWVSMTHPVLSGWNAQNVTSSVPFWDFVLSLSPAVLIGLFGLIRMMREGSNPARRILVTWFVLGPLLIYLPTTLQRRFMFGYFIPVAVMAGFGIEELRRVFRTYLQRKPVPSDHSPAQQPETPGRIGKLLFILQVPSTLLLLFMAILSTANTVDSLFMTKGEARALAWIEDHTPRDALILASPKIGTLIPAFTGRRVIWGHSFETINADEEELRVTEFFQTPGDEVSLSLLSERRVDYLFIGPRERELMGDDRNFDWGSLPELSPVFSDEGVQIYAVKLNP
ncbi:MAG: hypothetical protein GX491_08145 [Chloroflexi bacterium]|nr:hypothetical protein [Chloroflexota bacterium]